MGSCLSRDALCPSSGDTDNVLLQKILQSLNAGGGGGGGAGVSGIKVNGGATQTGLVSLTVPQNTDQLPEGATNKYFTNARAIASTLTGFVAGAGTVTAADSILTALQKASGVTNNLLNFRDDATHADGVVYINSGATEIFRTVGASSFLKFTTNATTMRLHTSALDDSFTFLASPAKADGAFLEVYGTSHVTGLGGATVSIHDGGEFRVRSAPVASTTSVIRFLVMGTTGQALFTAGTVAAPGAANLADVDTGWYWSAANELSASTGAVNALTLNSAQQVLLKAGTAASPALVVGNGTTSITTGFYSNAANQLAFSSLGTPIFRIVAGFFTFASTMQFVWTSGDAVAAGDTALAREGVGVLGLLGSSGASAATFRVNSIWADAANYARLSLDTITSATNTLIRTEAAGTGLTAGQPRILQVGTGPSVGTDIAGQNVIWHSGPGTGSGTGGSHLFQVSAPGASASTARALATRLTLNTTDLTMATAVRLAVASGTDQRAGNAVLVGGTVTVANTSVTANTIVMLTRKTSGGTIGTAITYTTIAATSFTINSDSVIDTSTFSYFLIEVP